MLTREAQNKDIVRRFYKAFENNDQAALEELLAPDLVAYSHGAPGPQDRQMHVQGILNWNATFSNTRFAVEEQIAEGDMVATHVTMRSTHDKDTFQGAPPTRKQVEIHATSLERIGDGKITERHVYSDWLGMLQQLGIIPPPQAIGAKKTQ